MEETKAPADPPAPRSIGERLRAGRERSGLSVAAAAEKLHLDPKVIDSLEADRFSELGASVYVRGHLRRYADFVGEPGAEFVSTYTAREARAPTPDLTRIPQAEQHSADPRRLVTPLTGVAAAAILLLAIWWVLAGSRSGESAQPTPLATPVVEPDTETSSDADDSSVAMADGTAALPPASATLPATPAISAVGPQVQREAAESTPQPVRETRLKLDLSKDSWVEIYDARGEKLYFDIAGAGSVQNVSGRGPLRVVLGDASGVTLEVDGQARAIPDGAIDGEGAKFVVNRSGSLSRAR